MDRIEIKRYFNAVREDFALFGEAMDYYQYVVDEASKYVTAIGHLETLAAETPGLEFMFAGVLTDAQQLRRWLETEYETVEAAVYKSFIADDAVKAEFGKLSTTDIKNFARADDRVVDMLNMVRMAAHAEHMLMDVKEGFSSRGIMISKIVDIRKEKLQEVYIDPTRETQNNG